MFHDERLYGDKAADAYDALYDRIADTRDAVECLADLAGGGAVLELGIGTGRLALPLAERGLEVAGIEASPAMVEQLRAKPGGEGIEVAIGDFTETAFDREFALAVLAFNTIFAPPTQDDQVRVFENAARHLEPGGAFVVEAFVFHDPGHPAVRPRQMSGEWVELQASRYDRASQRLETVLVNLTADGVKLIPANHRYATPAELDLMARLAGLELAERWGDWRRTPFSAASERHVSVYRRRHDDD